MWRCGGSNPGPFTCKANALPLSYIPYVGNECTICRNIEEDLFGTRIYQPAKNICTHGGTRTPNLRFRRPTPYPLGHAGTPAQNSCNTPRQLTSPADGGKNNIFVRRPGIEPGSQEWESCMIPLHQRRFDIPEQDLRNQRLFQEFYSSVTSVGACRIFLQ